VKYPKPVEQYKNINLFGDNIVSSEGDEWKRFRKISAPAFSEVRRHL
jgi:cytochrome P450